jgi:hypothetical protein
LLAGLHVVGDAVHIFEGSVLLDEIADLFRESFVRIDLGLGHRHDIGIDVLICMTSSIEPLPGQRACAGSVPGKSL